MKDTKSKVEDKLQEYYKKFEGSIPEDKELQEMCKNCENWCGEKHDYSECRNKPCFRFFLAYGYLNWETGWE